ncbi:hypothetical protein [Embleya sp. NPDC059237]|uniref:hypothetical protein n=1 Tax=Embleya sp. NPDC059237 TaxID=3346784 RepID=UPI0036BAC704
MSLGAGHDWRSIRSWNGSQHRAFEELCYQLREPAAHGWRTFKPAAPDGGVEWWDEAPNGSDAHGFQVKFVHNVDDLIPVARESAKTVGSNRETRNITRLTFLAPFDLSDPVPTSPTGRERRGARIRWDDAVARWKSELPGLSGVEIVFVGSGELLSRAARPEHEGRWWFFFDQEVFGPEWCSDMARQAQGRAGARYTPEHHVPLPQEAIPDACALVPEFRARIERAVHTAHKLVRMAVSDRMTPAADDCRQDMELLVRELVADRPLAVGFPAGDASVVVSRVLKGLDVLRYQRNSAPADVTDAVADDGVVSSPDPECETVNGRVWDDAQYACEALLELLDGEQGQAAETKAWLLTGPAGQGKTHLLVDAVRRAVGRGRPGLVLFGSQLDATKPLASIAAAAGMGGITHRRLLQAMDAAGAASGCRFFLAIDALNDANAPESWKTELPALLAALERYKHVALVVSCRSTLAQRVLPDVFAGATTEHPGFSGLEAEALEAYLRKLPSAAPQAPLLVPAFRNPLFVKLYAVGLERSGGASRGWGVSVDARDRSAVFDAFVRTREEEICTRLGLDPVERPVRAAVEAVAARMAEEGRQVLDRAAARGIVEAFAPHATEWPETMLGQLIAHEVLSTEILPGSEPSTGIGFPYQAFGDDLIVRHVLERHRDEVLDADPEKGLKPDSLLRAWLESASPNHIEAATMLVPGWFSTELVDLLCGRPGFPPGCGSAGPAVRAPQLRSLAWSLVSTLPFRVAGGVTERTVRLLRAAAAEYGLENRLLDSVISVTADPPHPLNADRLHRHLARIGRLERDRSWGIGTYSMLGDITALHRLLRWAETYPLPVDLLPESRPVRQSLQVRARPSGRAFEPATGGSDEEVVRLGATTLVWTLTSSNRFLRDRATKALVQLLLGHPDVLSGLLDRFLDEDAEAVDDPYLFERLVIVAYGVAARTGARYPERLQGLARRILRYVYGDAASPAHASRSVLLCDAAARVVELAARAGLIGSAEASAARHPHPCPDVGPARSREDLDLRLPTGEDPSTSWGPVLASLSDFGDFGRHRVQPAAESFCMLPLGTPYPRPSWERANDTPVVVPDAVPALAESLPADVREALSSPGAVERLLADAWAARSAFTDEQYALLQACRAPGSLDEQLADTRVSGDWARQWVLGRVADLGWSPARFGEFDRFREGRGRGREGHKPERIGKKYQWIAFHELIERLANHHHPYRQRPHDAAKYPGAAELLLVDIDPTLPPARHPFGPRSVPDRERDQAYATFPDQQDGGFWTPTPPNLPTPGGEEAWICGETNLPNLEQLAVRTDSDGRRWIVLDEYVTDDHDGGGWTHIAGEAEQWHQIHGWLVPARQRPALDTFLTGRSLIGRWMPEAPERRGVHWADFPRPAPRTEPDDDSHHVIAPQHDPEQDRSGIGAEDGEGASVDNGVISGAQALAETVTALRYGSSKHESDEDMVTAWYRRRELVRQENLRKLARRVSDDRAPAIEDTLPIHQGVPQAQAMYRGKPVVVVPAAQHYSHSAESYDCSLGAAVSVAMPCDLLLRDAGLTQSPATPHWYDTHDRLRVQYLTHTRPTGTVTTLLADREWLLDRLTDLELALVQGLLGERQRKTTNPRNWREFSQTASIAPNGNTRYQPLITTLASQR